MVGHRIDAADSSLRRTISAIRRKSFHRCWCRVGTVDCRCQDHAPRHGSFGLPYQAAPTGAIRVSGYDQAVLIFRLHGTYLAPKLIRQQRPISEIPDQPLLQDKLVLSRLRRVASVVFSRPSSREKSRFERAVLTVLWPAAVGMLALACGEVFRHLLSGDLTRQDVGSTQNYVRNSTFSDIEGSDATYHSIWPQVSAVVKRRC